MWLRALPPPAEAPKTQQNCKRLLTEALSQLAAELCAEVKADPSQIVEAVVVGNTAIHHLFLRLSVSQLGLAPYVPAMQSAIAVKAREIDLKIAPGAYVHLLPNIAGYVGADHVAMLLAIRIAQAEKTTLAIDIGTNTEICLNHQGTDDQRLVCFGSRLRRGAHQIWNARRARRH